jgi:tRNA modification GTPase trmE
MNDTIVAISTSLGVGAISIIRLSGKDSIEIVNSCFKGKDLRKVDTHTINYGYIIYNNEIIDEVLVSVMRAPKTYTTEDIVEINCHGGITSTNKILEIMQLEGCRLAEPGEFTKRAFLNGRIDLLESESIMDMINSKSEEARKLSMNGITGHISNKIESFREELKKVLSQIEVNIDYPEYYDIEVITEEKIKNIIKKLKEKLIDLVKDSENGITIKNGIKTVIVGRPNVGKSSILNKLLKEEKAIVTDIEGTTRDTVEGEILLDGILLNIIDTAGIRKTEDKVEKIGVEKSLSKIEEADLVILVINGSEELTETDKELLEETKDKTRIIVINKNDLKNKVNLNNNNIVYTNTLTDEGILTLVEKIKELFNLEQIKTKDYTYLSNTRQITLAKQALKNLLDAEKGIEENLPVDMVEIDLKNCFENLGEIIGKNYSNEIIDNLFKNFCVGK